MSALYLGTYSAVSRAGEFTLDGAREGLTQIGSLPVTLARSSSTLVSELSESVVTSLRGLHGYSAEADAALQKAMAKEGRHAPGSPLDAAATKPWPGGQADGEGASEGPQSPVATGGGVQLSSGGIVREVLNVDDGGIYSPAGAARAAEADAAHVALLSK